MTGELMKRVWQRCTLIYVLTGLTTGLPSPAAAQNQPSISAGNFTTYTIDSAGLLRSWGNDWWGQLGVGRVLRSN